MSIQSLIITADVPDDAGTAAEAAAAAFVASLPEEVDGLTIVTAVLGGRSLIPSPADQFSSALEALRSLAQGSRAPSRDDVTAAVAKVDGAARAYELSLNTGPAAPAGALDQAPAESPEAIAAREATLAATTTALPEEPAPDVPAVLAGDEVSTGA